MTAHEIIIRPIVSERSYSAMEENKYTFEVAKDANKFQIKDGHYGLANVAPTIVTMMGLQTPDCWQPSMI